MKNVILTIFALSLTGCATIIPVKRHFPDSVPELMVRCPDLKQTVPTTKLSDVVGTVVDNYGQYYTCQNKEDGWISWYSQQKANFNNADKKK